METLLQTFDFNDIRSFRDDEVNETLRNLVRDEGFLYILRKIFTEERIAHLSTELNDVKSVYDFQSKYISFYVNVLIRLSVLPGFAILSAEALLFSNPFIIPIAIIILNPFISLPFILYFV